MFFDSFSLVFFFFGWEQSYSERTRSRSCYILHIYVPKFLLYVLVVRTARFSLFVLIIALLGRVG